MLILYFIINLLVVIGFIVKGYKDKKRYIKTFIKQNIHPIIMLSEKIQAIIEKSYQNESLKRIDPKDIILENQTEVKELISDFSDQYREFKLQDNFLNEESLEKEL